MSSSIHVRTSLTVILSVFTVTFCAPAFGDSPYFAGLGTPQSRALGVSPDGSAVVGFKDSSEGREAMLWRGEDAIALGHLHGGARDSLARGTSATGVIVGRSRSAASGSDLYEAFRWEHGTMVGLGDLPDGFFYSEAWGVSADASVVVGRATSSYGTEAFRWDGTEMVGLGDLPGGLFSSVANDVSSDGSVVVGQGWSSSGPEAFRWENGIMMGLGDFLGGSFNSEALAVSADGSVVVGVGSTPFTTAFRWEDGVMTSLGFLPGGSGPSIPRAVSADGSVIVGVASMENSEPLEPFIYTQGQGMRKLVDVFDELGIDTSDWILEGVNDISDDGRTIVGTGLHLEPSVTREAWIAVVPEPHTFMLLLGGLAVASSRRSHRERRTK